MMSPSTNFDVEKYWDLEDIGLKELPKYLKGDDEALLHHSSTLTRSEDGRYQSAWPWKLSHPDLADNFQVALGRLKSLLRQLKQNAALSHAYSQIIEDQLEKGIIEPVPRVVTTNRVYYMPHHGVLTPSKATTKVRVVYDASSKSRKETASLNECLHRGPVLLEDLCGLLMRFRLRKVALVSDIEKAFLQIGLQESERDVTRFLWVADVNGPAAGSNMLIYRFCRVPFGIISSPFVLENTVRQHLLASSSDVAHQMLRDHYVDNVVTGENDDASAILHYREAKAIFDSARMNLREWYSNSDQVRASFSDVDRGRDSNPKVLGLRWNVNADSLRCEVSLKVSEDEPVTKREILRRMACVFDPLGWFAPVTVAGKLLVQELWRAGHAWDEPLPKDIVSSWRKICRSLAEIPSFEIPRFCCSPTDDRIELHVFCDASAKACAAVVYMRVGGANPSCNLMMAKTRLAPLKHIPTIPRLELIAATIGVRLLFFVQEQLGIQIGERYLWTDSQCTLYWIKGERATAPFIRNRVAEIRKHEGVHFRYVPSAENPADLPSRGCDLASLRQTRMWHHGPEWLTDSSCAWPDFDVSVAPMAADHCVVTADTPHTTQVLDETRFSSLDRLVRTTAFVFRFVNNARNLAPGRRTGPLGIDELRSAHVYWYRVVQAKSFPELVHFHGTTWPKGIGRQLNLFKDSEGILRCCGRIEAAELPFDTKYPILLPSSSHLTQLVIMRAHSQLIHSGVAQTLAQVRKRYWIVSGRSAVKSVLRACKRCARTEGGPFRTPVVPSLPPSRVVEDPPFTHVGLDYLGPLIVKIYDGSKRKVWICLYTCMVVRAVFLDVVEDLSAEQFLLSLRRFFAIYGVPRRMVSDNAPQFHKVSKFADKQWLTVLTLDRVQDFVAGLNIRWEFIVEFAPWMGGFYERLVGVVKRSLRKALDCATVTLSELRTVVGEISAVVNSRPLVYTEDEVGSVPLTPSHFIANNALCRLPNLTEVDDYEPPDSSRDTLVTKWKRLQAVTHKFWRSWRYGYLLSLREREVAHRQRNCSDAQPVVGAVVQIKENLPRPQWRLGKIVELHVSKDGHIRSVSVRLASGRSIKRPVKLLFPLECAANTDVDVQARPEPSAPTEGRERRTQRRAAANARAMFQQQLDDAEESS